jgi:hypothetical protein
VQKDPFPGFNMSKREVERTALTEHELEKLSNMRFSIERLEGEVFIKNKKSRKNKKILAHHVY